MGIPYVGPAPSNVGDLIPKGYVEILETESELNARVSTGEFYIRVTNTADWPVLRTTIYDFPITMKVVVTVVDSTDDNSVYQVISSGGYYTYERKAWRPDTMTAYVWGGWIQTPSISAPTAGGQLLGAIDYGSGPNIEWVKGPLNLSGGLTKLDDLGEGADQYSYAIIQGVVRMSNTAALTGLSELTGHSGEGIFLHRVAQQYNSYEWIQHQEVRFVHRDLGPLKITRYRTSPDDSWGPWGSWSSWVLQSEVPSAGMEGVPTYIQDSEPAVTGPAVWYQTSGGVVIKKWVQLS